MPTMMTNGTPQLLPEPQPQAVAPNITLVAPITRQGIGPGLIVLVDELSKGLYINNGVPSPLQKWGEEGYTVAEICSATPDVISTALAALKAKDKCQPSQAFGIVAYDAKLWNSVASQVSKHTDIVAAVVYTDTSEMSTLAPSPAPLLVHAAGKARGTLSKSSTRLEYDYAAQSLFFASPMSPHFDYATEAVSHTRNLTHLKKLMCGPYFDLEALWDEHTYYEFEVRDVEATMATMVQEPYVNHIPTLTGGIGRANLTAFYRDHFVFSNPKDTELELISRTVGVDRVVDEFLFKLTHDRVVDWLFPGIPATGKYVQIPFMAVVNLRGDRLYHEHITWDHATALRQIGWLPESLPYIAPHHGISGKINGVSQQQLILPVAGAEGAKKLRDKNAVASNMMFTEAGVKTVTQQ